MIVLLLAVPWLLIFFWIIIASAQFLRTLLLISLTFFILIWGATLPENVFANQQNLEFLDLSSNTLEYIPVGLFRPLQYLQTIRLGNANLSTINNEWFTTNEHLQDLGLANNRISLSTENFVGLERLLSLNLGYNAINEIPAGVFAQLPNLQNLNLNGNNFNEHTTDSFPDLGNLTNLDIGDNPIAVIHEGAFRGLVNLNSLGIQNGQLRQLHSNSFEGLGNLTYISLNFNEIEELPLGVDTITEAEEEYSFFEGPQPGIALRVNTANEVQIALTPFNFLWSPMIEILIGTTNNTRSVIRINEETNVVTVPTPNIITRDQWNDFRVTWENRVILVYSGNNTFPFMAFTMQDFYPVNFYGLRAIGTTASWSVQPFDL